MSATVRSAVVALASVLAALPAAADGWSPAPEPAVWVQTRQQLQTSGAMTDRPWQFMEALETPELMAGEYLSGRTRTAAGVEFDAGLLLRRDGVEDWQVRELRMRALCNQQRLQRLAGGNQWVDYVGRDDTASKVAWICDIP